MSSSDDISKPPNSADGDDGFGMPEMNDRFYAGFVLENLDFDSQLQAIRSVLSHNKEADEKLIKSIKELEEQAKKLSGMAGEFAESDLIAHYHHSTYLDAAHSMSAVGMLAPLIESILHQSFDGIRKHDQKTTPFASQHERWQRPAEDQWDCHYVWTRGRRSTNLVEGIMQLAEAVGLTVDLPGNLRLTLQALFEYRNKMFHNGFEWPVPERESFQKRIENAGWPKRWFTSAEISGRPWVFYMTQEYIDHCLTTVDQVIEAVGRYWKREFLDKAREFE